MTIKDYMRTVVEKKHREAVDRIVEDIFNGVLTDYQADDLLTEEDIRYDQAMEIVKAVSMSHTSVQIEGS